MKIKILSTSDVHGYWYPTNYSKPDDTKPLGLLKAASIINHIRQNSAADDLVITIENGDFIQGSPLTYYAAKIDPQAQAMYMQLTNKIGYDVGILGNHEFNYGIDYLQNCEQNRHYPILAANIQTNSSVIDAPYKIIEHQGLKIAIVGFTTQYIPHWEDQRHIQGWQFDSVVQTAKTLIPQLRKQADIIIVAYHGGFERDLKTNQPTEELTGENEGSQLLQEVPGIDALVTGHQHRSIATKVNGIPVTQPGYQGRYVGEITLELDADNHIIKQNAQLHEVAAAKLDADLQALSSNLEQQVQTWLDQVQGQINGDMIISDPMQARLHNHPYLDFINKVQMAATQTDIAGTALFNNDVPGFGHRVSLRNILTSYPFANTLAVEVITDAEMKAALEQAASYFAVENGQVQVAADFLQPKVQHYNYDIYSGIDYEFDLQQPVGQRVVKLQYHGQDVLPQQELEVTLNRYRAAGNGNYSMFSSDKIIREVQIDMTELISDYFQKHPVVQAIQPTNFTVKY